MPRETRADPERHAPGARLTPLGPPTHDPSATDLAADPLDGDDIRVYPGVGDIQAILDRIGRPRESLGHRLVMRALDVAVSALVLTVAAPLILVIAITILIDSPGPAVFRQTRVGRDGRLFHFYKFRTMFADAAERFPHLYAYDHSEDELPTLYFKLADDPRLTRVGRYLRRTSLDELPNFINVLKGDTTLVGPRPEIPQMIRYYQPDELVKFAVKPGVTGLAQISGRNILRFQETLAHDIEYVKRRSLRFDLLILSRTPRTVIRMIGAL